MLLDIWGILTIKNGKSSLLSFQRRRKARRAYSGSLDLEYAQATFSVAVVCSATGGVSLNMKKQGDLGRSWSCARWPNELYLDRKLGARRNFWEGCPRVGQTRLFMRDRQSAKNGLFCGFSPAALEENHKMALNLLRYKLYIFRRLPWKFQPKRKKTRRDMRVQSSGKNTQNRPKLALFGHFFDFCDSNYVLKK